MTTPVHAYIALGSNLGDRQATIERAVGALRHHPDVNELAVSSLHETEPVGVLDQPPFLNAAALVRTTLPPAALMALLLDIELHLGRTRRAARRWGPRPIDLDLLLYGDAVIDQPGLTVPHPRMHERLFVLEPLVEIAAGVVHPVLRVTVESLRQSLRTVSAAASAE